MVLEINDGWRNDDEIPPQCLAALRRFEALIADMRRDGIGNDVFANIMINLHVRMAAAMKPTNDQLNHLAVIFVEAVKAIRDGSPEAYQAANPIEQVRDFIRRKHPDARIDLTPPLFADSVWHLDVNLGAPMLVQWSAATGFMVTRNSNEKGYGEGADEAFESVDETIAWVIQQIRLSRN